MAKAQLLDVISGNIYELNPDIKNYIGTGKWCRIKPAQEEITTGISDCHAYVKYAERNDEWYIEDLNSKLGTSLEIDGQKIEDVGHQKIVLSDTCLINLGGYVFQFLEQI